MLHVVKSKLWHKDIHYVLLGATNENTRRPFWVLIEMLKNGYKVQPVKPGLQMIGDTVVMPNLQSCFPEIDVVIISFATKADMNQNGLEMLKDMMNTGLHKVIFDMGSLNLKMFNFLCEHAFDFEMADLVHSARRADFLVERDNCFDAIPDVSVDFADEDLIVFDDRENQ